MRRGKSARGGPSCGPGRDRTTGTRGWARRGRCGLTFPDADAMKAMDSAPRRRQPPSGPRWVTARRDVLCARGETPSRCDEEIAHTSLCPFGDHGQDLPSAECHPEHGRIFSPRPPGRSPTPWAEGRTSASCRSSYPPFLTIKTTGEREKNVGFPLPTHQHYTRMARKGAAGALSRPRPDGAAEPFRDCGLVTSHFLRGQGNGILNR